MQLACSSHLTILLQKPQFAFLVTNCGTLNCTKSHLLHNVAEGDMIPVVEGLQRQLRGNSASSNKDVQAVWMLNGVN